MLSEVEVRWKHRVCCICSVHDTLGTVMADAEKTHEGQQTSHADGTLGLGRCAALRFDQLITVTFCASFRPLRACTYHLLGRGLDDHGSAADAGCLGGLGGNQRGGGLLQESGHFCKFWSA